MTPSDLARTVIDAPSWQAQYRIDSNGTDPAANTILADTGELAAGYYDVYAYCTASVALGIWNMGLQWRNAANNGSNWTQVVCTAGADMKSIILKNCMVLANERFRWTNVNAFIGWYSISIFVVKRI